MIIDVGKHRVQCSDIMNGIDNLMQGNKADFIYSDPPWGQGNLKYWQTINKRHTGEEPNEIDYKKFLPHFFDIVYKYAKNIVVIEYGVKWRDDVKNIATLKGFKHHGQFTSLYQASKLLPLDIHILSKNNNVNIPKNFSEKCFELRKLPLVKYIFEALLPVDAKIVLDPMCGMGFTAQATVDKGLIFFGNELNSKRLQKTITRLRK